MSFVHAVWSKWQLPPETPSDGRARALDSLLAPTSLPRAPPESNGSQTPPSPVATASRGDKLPPPYSFPSPLVHADPGPSLAPPTPPTALSLSDVVTPAQRPRSHTAGIAELHRESTEFELDTGTYDRRKKVLRRAVRIKKAVVSACLLVFPLFVCLFFACLFFLLVCVLLVCVLFVFLLVCFVCLFVLV